MSRGVMWEGMNRVECCLRNGSQGRALLKMTFELWASWQESPPNSGQGHISDGVNVPYRGALRQGMAEQGEAWVAGQLAWAAVPQEERGDRDLS